MLLHVVLAFSSRQQEDVPPPVFLKLHKVGSTTAVSFLQCQSRRFNDRCCACLQKRENIRCENHAGPWGHDVALKYPYVGQSDVFERCGCASSPKLVMMRDPVDRFFSMVNFFFEKRSKTFEERRLARAVVNRPTSTTPEQALRMLQLFDQRYPTWGRGSHHRFGELMYPVRLPEYGTTFRQVGETNTTPQDWDARLATQHPSLVVGLTHAMRTSLALFAVALGWDHDPDVLCLPVPNMRKRPKARRSSYKESVRAAISDSLRDEVDVYQAAERLHNAQVAKYRRRIADLLAASANQTQRCQDRRAAALSRDVMATKAVLQDIMFPQKQLIRLCELMSSVDEKERGNVSKTSHSAPIRSVTRTR